MRQINFLHIFCAVYILDNHPDIINIRLRRFLERHLYRLSHPIEFIILERPIFQRNILRNQGYSASKDCLFPAIDQATKKCVAILGDFQHVYKIA